jgi:hypothetical protein
MAWGALRPRDNKVEPAVHAVVLMLSSIGEHAYMLKKTQCIVVNQNIRQHPANVHKYVRTYPQMTQYPAKPCHVQVLLSSGIGIRSRLHQKVLR